MRVFLYILLFTTSFLGACYKDKGNYDYNPIPKIEMKGINSAYSVLALEKLTITPEFSHKEDYKGTWTMFSKKDIVVDTIYSGIDLDYLVTQGAGEYTLILTLENLKNQDVQIFKTEMSVSTVFSTGWYALKNIGGKTDVDHINGDWMISNNILSGMHGSSLAGKPVGIAQTAEISYIDEEGSKVKGVRALWAVSDEEGRMMRLEDMKLGYNFNQAFFEWIPDQIPIGIQTMSTSMSYQSNKGIFDMPMNVGTVMNRFGEPLKIQNLSSGAPELYILAKQNFIAPGLAMYYDELNTRFLLLLNGELYRFSDLDSRGNPAAIKPNATNCNVLYMAKSGNFGYALMQDRAKPNRYLYKLNFNPYYNSNNYYSPIIENRNVSAGMKLYQAKVFGHNQDLAYLFYSTGSDLNMYDYDAGKENVNVVPVYDGQVTYIQHIDKYLIVATENAGRYKIYFYEMLAGRPDLSKDVKVVEGEGAVQGLTFAGLKK